jgi:signal peptidase I
MDNKIDFDVSNSNSGSIDKETEVKKSKVYKSVIREHFESLITVMIMWMFLMTFTLQSVHVPTGSMQNTILIGDRLLINKFIFAPGKHLPFLPQREIRRGDIIVFKWPGNKVETEISVRELDQTSIPFKTHFVKRVIGLPGETIEIRGTQVLINNQPLDEEVVEAIDHMDKSPLGVLSSTNRTKGTYRAFYSEPNENKAFGFGSAGSPVLIPADHYFVMGDNRNDSLDSRFWGFVPRDLIFGRAMFVFWSVDESIPSSGNFLSDIFYRARWNRIGTMIK